MKEPSKILPIIIFPIALVGMLQLGGCAQTGIPLSQEGGTYLSTSAGARFTQSVEIEGEEGVYIANFALGEIHRPKHKSDTVYIAAGNQGIVVSENDGDTWKVIRTSLAQTLDIVLLANGTLVASGTNAEGQGLIVRSLDEGKSWHVVLTIPTPKKKGGINIIGGGSSKEVSSILISIEPDPFKTDRLYAGSSLGTIFAGEQSAKTWSSIHTVQEKSSGSARFAVLNIVPSPFTQGEILIVTKDQQLARINNDGQSFITVPQYINEPNSRRSLGGTRKIRDVTYIEQYPDGLLVATEQGVVATRDNGETWMDLGLPVEESQIFNSVVVAVSPTNADRLLVAINGVIYRSEDGGRSWNTFSLNLANHIIQDISINPRNAGRVLTSTMQLNL